MLGRVKGGEGRERYEVEKEGKWRKKGLYTRTRDGEGNVDASGDNGDDDVFVSLMTMMIMKEADKQTEMLTETDTKRQAWKKKEKIT